MKKLLLPLSAALVIACSASAQDSTDKPSSEAQQKEKSGQPGADKVEQRAADAQERARTEQDKARVQADAAGERTRISADKVSLKLNEYDEIVIKKKNDNPHEKVVIEINDEKVTVNGKPLEDFIDEDVSVRLRSPRRYTFVHPGSPFRNQRGEWHMESDEIGDPNQGFLGVTTDKDADGARVTSVMENGAAAKSGLKNNDVITRVNDQPIADQRQLAQAISNLKAGDKVTITYKRDGKERKTTAVLGKRTLPFGTHFRHPGDLPELPERPEPPMPDEYGRIEAPLPPMNFSFDHFGDNFEDAFNMHGKPRLGLKVQDTEDGKGVKVLDVDDDSPAAKAGIKSDDLITSFDGKTVNAATELADASREAKDKTSVKVQLKRNGKNQEVELKTPRKLKTASL